MGEMYDTTTATATATATPCTNNNNNNNDDISLFIQHLLNSSSSTPTHQYSYDPCKQGVTESDYYGPIDSSGFEIVGDAVVGVKRRKFPLENNDLDDFDCESEEGLEVSDGPSRSRTCSKRSRAAEVHNLSEKRRRSRINEKMKALQNLIPNSNKTDKASMLDEAIEYLKQLQLQVQMLSMRNGLSLHPMYLPGVLQPDARMSFSDGNGLQTHTSSMETSKLPLNQDSTAQTSFGLSNQCTTSQQSLAIPSLANITNSDRQYGLTSPIPAHQGPFQELYRGGILPQQPLPLSHSTRNPAENGVRPVAAESLSFDRRPPALNEIKNVEPCSMRMDRSQDVDSNQILFEHLHSLQTGRSMLNDDGRIHTMNF